MRRNRLEKGIEISAWIVSALLWFKFVPKNRVREAIVALSFKHIITWLIGLIVVENNLISYPYRLFFKKANKSSFTFEYFVYPVLCTLFNLYYPENRNNLIKLSYYTFYSGIITIFEVFAEKWTNLIKYNNWNWQLSFLTMWITYYLSRIYYRWFFRLNSNHV